MHLLLGKTNSLKQQASHSSALNQASTHACTN